MGPSTVGVRLRHAGLRGAIGVLLVILAFAIVPPVLAQLPPSQGEIRPGTELKIGKFAYTPNPSWTEERARSERGMKSVISKDGQELRVQPVSASSPSQAYVAAAKQLTSQMTASIGSGSPITTPAGLHGRRGTFVSPAGDGIRAAFSSGGNAGLSLIATNMDDNGAGDPQEVDAMINSVRSRSS